MDTISLLSYSTAGGGGNISPLSPEVSKKNRAINPSHIPIPANIHRTKSFRDKRYLSLPNPLSPTVIKTKGLSGTISGGRKPIEPAKKKKSSSKKIQTRILFSCRHFRAIPFDPIKMNTYLYENRRSLGNNYKFAIDCFFDNGDVFELAHSTLDRFLIKHPDMNHERFLPCLRFTALLIILKYLEDESIFNEDYLATFPQPSFTIERVNKMEVAFLQEIDWIIEPQIGTIP